MAYSTTELIEQVRSQIQEKNQSALSDADILNMLNRAQDYAINIMARRYNEPLLAQFQPTFDSDHTVAIPDDAFEQRVLAVEVKVGSIFRELEPISYDKTYEYERGTLPDAYALIGNRIHVYPKASSEVFRIWYLKTVPELVEDEGRVIGIDDLLPHVENYSILTGARNVTISGVPTNAGGSGTEVYRVEVTNSATNEFRWSNNGGATYTTGVTWVDDVAQVLEEGITVKFASSETYVDADAWTFDVEFTNANITLDAVGSKLSTTGAYTKFVNIIDFNLGTIRATMEINTIDTDTGVITFKETPSRPTVLNRPVSSSIPSDVELDDYICPVQGSCVLFFKQPIFNFVLQFAVAEARRSLGYDVTVEENKLRQMEKQLQKIRSNRAQTWEVKMNNPRWR